MQPAADSADLRIVEDQQRKVHQVYAEVHDTAAAGLLQIVEPGLVRAVCVVKHEICGVDLAELAASGQVHQLRNARNRAIAQIYAQQPVAGSGGPYDLRSLRGSSGQRFLTKHGAPMLERGCGLSCVQAAGSGNDDSVEILREQLLKVADDPCAERTRFN